MPALVGGRILAAKVESVFGTDEFGGSYAAEDVLPIDPTTIRVDPAIEEFLNRATMGYLGTMPSSLGATSGTIAWRQAVRGRGVAYDDSPEVVPEWDLGIRGCGHGRVISTTTGVESVTYQPVAVGDHVSLTIYVIQPMPSGEALLLPFTGCRGTGRVTGAVGGPSFVEFTFQGEWQAEDDIAFTNGTLAPTPKFPFLAGAALQVGAADYAPAFSRYTLDFNNTLVREPSGNAATGYLGYIITQREPLLTFDPTMAREGDSGWYAALTGASLVDMTFQSGITQYNRMKVKINADAAAQGQVVAKRFADRDGIAAFEIGIRPSISGTAENDYAIVAD